MDYGGAKAFLNVTQGAELYQNKGMASCFPSEVMIEIVRYHENLQNMRSA